MKQQISDHFINWKIPEKVYYFYEINFQYCDFRMQQIGKSWKVQSKINYKNIHNCDSYN